MRSLACSVLLYIAIAPGPAVFAFPQQRERVSQSFAVSAGGILEMLVAGDIRIKTWEKDVVEVVAEAVPEEERSRLVMFQKDQRVRVEYQPRRRRSNDVRFIAIVPSHFNLDLRTAGGDIVLETPLTGQIEGSTSGGDLRLAEVRGNVVLTTSGGDVRTTNILGDAVLKTSGGDIEADTIGGDLQASTSGGDIRIMQVGKNLKASTSGGDVTVGDVGGDATVSTSGGTIRMRKISGTATLKTSGGNLQIQGDIGGPVTISTTGSDIKLKAVKGSASLTTSGGDIEVHGARDTVVAKTSGGDIILREIEGSVEARTSGGDILVELRPRGTGLSTLATTGGDISLFLPESASATIEARIEIRGNWERHSRTSSIRSDFPAESHEMDAQQKEIRARYVLGGGDQRIILATINGNIAIKALRSR
ncbi:MAG TPA: hypothetical protein VNM72_00685 [Blastocatellia bacterium]|nr:hypothetical protein [Blastocatellia bacterium]